MSEERPEGDAPIGGPARSPEEAQSSESHAVSQPAAGVTESGYHYSVVDDAPSARSAARGSPRAAREPKAPREPLRVGRLALAALIIVPALIVGIAVWGLVGALTDGDDGDTSPENVASVINAFSQGQGADALRRYERELPPGLPEDLPAYEGARVVSSLVQVSGDDAVYLVVYDTPDTREDVAGDLQSRFTDDPWQIDAGQDSRDGTLRQFSRIDDADVTGIFLVTDSRDADVTTIFLSLQVIAGAGDVDLEDFEPAASKPIPDDFPDDIPPYPDANVIETAFERAPEGDVFAVSSITRDSANQALDFYREELEGDGFTVTDVEPQTNLAGASAIAFESEDGNTAGNVTAGDFADDRNFTRIDLQLRTAN